MRWIQIEAFGPPDVLRPVEAPAPAPAPAGQLRPIIGQSFPLEQATAAHAAMDARSTIGKTLLVPGASN